MKTCPNCGELIGDSVSICFNCQWNFDDPSENEKAAEREKARKEAEERRRIELQEYEEQRFRDEEQRRRDAVRREAENRANRQKLIEKLNNTYEYEVFTVQDKADGTQDTERINRLINEHAAKKWKLHSIFTNEIGKTSSTSGFGGITSGTNATIEQTVIVMERIIATGYEA